MGGSARDGPQGTLQGRLVEHRGVAAERLRRFDPDLRREPIMGAREREEASQFGRLSPAPPAGSARLPASEGQTANDADRAIARIARVASNTGSEGFGGALKTISR